MDSFQTKNICEEEEVNQSSTEKTSSQELYQPFPDDLDDYIQMKTLEANNLHRKEYKKIQEKFVDSKPTKELLDDLEKLAQEGLDEAAIDIGHYAIGHASEDKRAKRLLKKAQDPYAIHLLGVLISSEGDDECALELFLKAWEMGLPTSLVPIFQAVEANPGLKSGKYAQQIGKALSEYYDIG